MPFLYLKNLGRVMMAILQSDSTLTYFICSCLWHLLIGVGCIKIANKYQGNCNASILSYFWIFETLRIMACKLKMFYQRRKFSSSYIWIYLLFIYCSLFILWNVYKKIFLLLAYKNFHQNQKLTVLITNKNIKIFIVNKVSLIQTLQKPWP